MNQLLVYSGVALWVLIALVIIFRLWVALVSLWFFKLRKQYHRILGVIKIMFLFSDEKCYNMWMKSGRHGYLRIRDRKWDANIFRREMQKKVKRYKLKLNKNEVLKN